MSAVNFTPPVSNTPPVDSAAGIGAAFNQSLFNQINTNTQDSGVSRQEFQTFLENQGTPVDTSSFDRAFDQADTSGDNFLSYQEIEAAWNDFAQLGASSQSQGGNNDSSGSENGGQKSCGGTEGAGQAGGSDGSSGLSSLWDLLLRLADKNGDGKIDADELEALKEGNPELAGQIDGLLEKAGIDPAEGGITKEKLQGAVDAGKITTGELNTLTEALGMN